MTKPTELQGNARKIAADAFLEGKMIEGKTILDNARTKLAKPQAKKIAHILAKQGRFDAATEVLLLSNWSEIEAKEELAPAPTANVGDILYTAEATTRPDRSLRSSGFFGATATIRKLTKRTVSAARTTSNGASSWQLRRPPDEEAGTEVARRQLQAQGWRSARVAMGRQAKARDRRWVWTLNGAS